MHLRARVEGKSLCIGLSLRALHLHVIGLLVDGIDLKDMTLGG